MPSEDSNLSQVITANRLTDGSVVYLTSAGDWSRRIGGAAVAAEKSTAEALLAAARQAEQRREVVGAYTVEVAAAGDAVTPVKRKEAIRALGPTTHPGFGIQAEGGSAAAYANGV
ncbi:MAG: DUF2849 domain-containing protein [Rhodospirillales bacterium]